MQLYSCTVRLGGAMTNEVAKEDVTAAEVKVLQAIHHAPEAGVATVYGITPTGKTDRSDAEERERLFNIYAKGLMGQRLTLDSIFGPDAIPLPQAVPGVGVPEKPGRKKVVVPVEETAEGAPELQFE